MLGDEVCSPGIDRAAVSQITIRDGSCSGAGALPGDDIASVVAYVEGMLRSATKDVASMQDRKR